MKPALQIPIVLVAFLFLTACANLERNSYRTIGSIVVAVDTAMNGWGEYVRAGKAKPDEEAIVRQMYGRYQTTMKVAESALTAYQKSPDASQLQRALNAASAAAEDLVVWIYEYVPSESAQKAAAALRKKGP